jgi:hypothetical protein
MKSIVTFLLGASVVLLGYNLLAPSTEVHVPPPVPITITDTVPPPVVPTTVPHTHEELVGATGAEIPKSVALFETSLASAISSSATSMTLVSATDATGTALASSTYAFIIDEGSASQEMVIADCTSTACTRMIRGISPITGTTTVAALQKSHRRGASVKITDGPQIMILSRLLNGQGLLPNYLKYATSLACTSGSSNNTICDKAYIDGVAVAGASNANDTTKGIIEMALAAEAASSTSLGGTGARLTLGANLSTESCTAASQMVIVSKTNGKINKNCIDQGVSYAWTSTNDFGATTTMDTLTLDTGKRLGIGSTTPYEELGINGNLGSNGLFEFTGTGSSTLAGSLAVSGNASTTHLTISGGIFGGPMSYTGSSTGVTLAGTDTITNAIPRLANTGIITGVVASGITGTLYKTESIITREGRTSSTFTYSDGNDEGIFTWSGNSLAFQENQDTSSNSSWSFTIYWYK